MTDPISRAFRYSRYADKLNRRDPETVDRVLANPQARFPLKDWRKTLETHPSEGLDECLRKIRREAMLRSLVRDIAFASDHVELVSDLSAFADLCVDVALGAQLAKLGESSESLGQLSVIGMGKLGGFELNVSSDIDIVFVCDEPTSDQIEQMNRIANAVTRSLDREVDGDFVFRVDTRLRPYGSAGPMVPTLDFLETYFVTQGRTWERLAWLRARVIAGPLAGSVQSLVTPFVFRRYLDFDAIDGVRDLHRQLRAEKTDPNNVKLGRGGIRELEFGVQLRQILRGGRDSRLQAKNTLDALAAFASLGYLSVSDAECLSCHYRYLRRVEHMLQYRDDLQTQTLPRDDNELGQLAEALGEADSGSFSRRLDNVRDEVARFFDETLGGMQNADANGGASGANALSMRAPGTLSSVSADERSIDFSGYADADEVARYHEATLTSARARSLPVNSRQRLESLAARVVQLALQTSAPRDAHARTLDLLVGVAGRSSYLALMTERPETLRRVVDLAASSEWATRYLMSHPLLLDELIDARSLTSAIDYESWRAELTRALAAQGDDTEAGMDALRHFQQAEVFRLLLKDVAGLLSVEALSDHLSALADVCVDVTLRKLLAAAKLPMEATLTVIAYGKWGSKELGYASDLDLIFLMPNEATEYRDVLTRVAQRLQNWLTTLTPAGRAYEIDVRLRPDGVSGLLLSTVDAFATYQREKAWTWEHQAITRARFAAGNRALGAEFEKIRDNILALPRDWPKLRVDIVEMRERIAREHPNRDRETLFDLKHDRGGLVDMEFAVQALVLRYGAAYPAMRLDHGNIALAKRAGELGLLGPDGERIANAAADAYRELRKLQHAVRLRGADKARVSINEASALAAAVTEFFDQTLTQNL